MKDRAFAEAARGAARRRDRRHLSRGQADRDGRAESVPARRAADDRDDARSGRADGAVRTVGQLLQPLGRWQGDAPLARHPSRGSRSSWRRRCRPARVTLDGLQATVLALRGEQVTALIARRDDDGGADRTLRRRAGSATCCGGLGRGDLGGVAGFFVGAKLSALAREGRSRRDRPRAARVRPGARREGEPSRRRPRERGAAGAGRGARAARRDTRAGARRDAIARTRLPDAALAAPTPIARSRGADAVGRPSPPRPRRRRCAVAAPSRPSVRAAPPRVEHVAARRIRCGHGSPAATR